MAEGGERSEVKEEVFRVGVRIPPFWPEEPVLWFAQIEGQFVLSKINQDETKFYYVIGHLELRYALEIKDIITSPPATNKYKKLKSELIKRLSASQEKRIQKLLTHEELGDRKPSQFLRHLQDLAGSSGASEFVKTLWTNRLPHHIQTVIAVQTNLPLDQLAEIADRVYEIAPAAPQVASTSAAPSLPTTPAATTPSYGETLTELTRQVALLTTQMNSRRRHFPRPRSRSRSKPRRYDNSHNKSGPKQPPPNHPHCFYHYTYGAAAKKCKEPCTFNSENFRGSRK
ncbi:uncharacterized protein LOC113238758 [Hyposmocoma kahamanoa]|uniref:uncharacterized protein LOC113238758 n=1 Tax=Hyposmocoma kahamanoa TaxID=1477025 RepID=UPI000E6D9E87|nr:uncharacterized protein LOC113238758 [Hyposmocoma kahamanoa]